jgi:hypothetical protein
MALMERLREAEQLGEGWQQCDGLRWTRAAKKPRWETVRLAEAGTVEGWQWIYEPPHSSYPCQSWAFFALSDLLQWRADRAMA